MQHQAALPDQCRYSCNLIKPFNVFVKRTVNFGNGSYSQQRVTHYHNNVYRYTLGQFSPYTYKLSNPHFHSQSYLSCEYILLCANYRTKRRQCIVSITIYLCSSYVPLPTSLLLLLWSDLPLCFLQYRLISCSFHITFFWVYHSCATSSG